MHAVHVTLRVQSYCMSLYTPKLLPRLVSLDYPVCQSAADAIVNNGLVDICRCDEELVLYIT